MFSPFFSIALSLALLPTAAFGFDMSRNDNVAVYWGQNAYGAVNPGDTANWQQRLDFYCQDDSIDTIPLAFLNIASDEGGMPTIDMSNMCSTSDGTFAGTSLPNCQDMATDIKACQAKGKIITLSIGGATSDVILSSDSDGTTFANNVWNLFLGGTSDNRPFGDAVLDGVDLDLESGSGVGYGAFVTQLRSLASSAGTTLYVTGAPQCPYPDTYIGSVLNDVGFDAVYVQFYNNYCGLTAASTSEWNFASWDSWAKSSPNPDVKVYIGAPGASAAAGSGYVDATTLASIAQSNRDQYSSFGGIMLWEASIAYMNNRFDAAAKAALAGGSSSGSSSSSASASTSGSGSASTSVSPSSSSQVSASSSSPISKTSTSVGSSVTQESSSAAVPSSTAPASSHTKSSFSSKVSTSSRIYGSSSVAFVASASDSSAVPSSTVSSGATGVSAWDAATTYWVGDKVTYSGSSWTAKWWTVGDTPGVQEGDVEQSWEQTTSTKRAVLTRHARRFGRISH